MKNSSSHPMKPLSVRLDIVTHLHLQKAAERSGATLGEYTRDIIKRHVNRETGDLLSPNAKLIIENDEIMKLIAFALGSALAMSANMPAKQQDIAQRRGNEFIKALRRLV